jgi:hypothetical protein
MSGQVTYDSSKKDKTYDGFEPGPSRWSQSPASGAASPISLNYASVSPASTPATPLASTTPVSPTMVGWAQGPHSQTHDDATAREVVSEGEGDEAGEVSQSSPPRSNGMSNLSKISDISNVSDRSQISNTAHGDLDVEERVAVGREVEQGARGGQVLLREDDDGESERRKAQSIEREQEWASRELTHRALRREHEKLEASFREERAEREEARVREGEARERELEQAREDYEKRLEQASTHTLGFAYSIFICTRTHAQTHKHTRSYETTWTHNTQERSELQAWREGERERGQEREREWGRREMELRQEQKEQKEQKRGREEQEAWLQWRETEEREGQEQLPVTTIGVMRSPVTSNGGIPIILDIKLDSTRDICLSPSPRPVSTAVATSTSPSHSPYSLASPPRFNKDTQRSPATPSTPFTKAYASTSPASTQTPPEAWSVGRGGGTPTLNRLGVPSPSSLLSPRSATIATQTPRAHSPASTQTTSPPYAYASSSPSTPPFAVASPRALRSPAAMPGADHRWSSPSSPGPTHALHLAQQLTLELQHGVYAQQSSPIHTHGVSAQNFSPTHGVYAQHSSPMYPPLPVSPSAPIHPAVDTNARWHLPSSPTSYASPLYANQDRVVSPLKNAVTDEFMPPGQLMASLKNLQREQKAHVERLRQLHYKLTR